MNLLLTHSFTQMIWLSRTIFRMHLIYIYSDYDNGDYHYNTRCPSGLLAKDHAQPLVRSLRQAYAEGDTWLYVLRM